MRRTEMLQGIRQMKFREVFARTERRELMHAEAADDLADVQAYDEARRRLAAGEDELIPAEFANRILDGENPVRV